MGFLSRSCNGKGPHLSLRGESPSFSRVAAGNMGFLLSYEWDLRDPLVLPQESLFSMCVARGLLRFFSSGCSSRGPHLELRPESQVSSPVLDLRVLRVPLMFSQGSQSSSPWRHESLLPSRARKAVSGFLVSCHRDRWLSLKLPPGFHNCHRVLSQSSG